MISEIDLRDWGLSITAVRQSVDSLSGLPTPYPYEQVIAIEAFIEKVEKYINSNSVKIAAVLRAPVPPSDEYQSAWQQKVKWGVGNE
jgi:hypothetical protein